MAGTTRGYRIGEASGITGLSPDTLRLRFIRRVQKMAFSLGETGRLPEMPENPGHAREEVRLLVHLCRGSEERYPVTERMDAEGET